MELSADQGESPVETDGREEILAAGQHLGHIVESTYGPYGMDKLLVDAVGDMSATNSGSRILEMVEVTDPVARMVLEACTPAGEGGDGSTFSVLLAVELLDEATELIDRGVSPVTIADGYVRARDRAAAALEEVSVDVSPEREERYAIAKTATAGRFTELDREHLRRVVLDVVDVLRPEDVSTEALAFEEDIRLGIDSSRTVRGAVVRSEVVGEAAPDTVRDASVLLLEEGVVPVRDRGDDERLLTVDDPDDYEAFLEYDRETVVDRAQQVIDLGADVVVSTGHLHEYATDHLNRAGVLAVHELRNEQLDRIQRAVGGETTVSTAIPGTALGGAGQVTVSEIGSGTRPAVVFGDCDSTEIATVIVNGGTTRVTAEARRTIAQGVAAVAATYTDPRVVPGGGAAELEAARRVEAEAEGGVGSMAVRAYADALTAPVATLAANAGCDPIDVLATLRAHHDDGAVDAGVDVETGGTMRAYEMGVIEPVRSKRRAIRRATDIVTTLLRIDGILPMTGGDVMDTLGAKEAADADPGDRPDLSSGSKGGLGLG